MGFFERLRNQKFQWFGLGTREKRPALKKVVWITFTATAITAALLMGISMQARFMKQTREGLEEDAVFLMEQAAHSFTVQIRNVMKVSDSLYYSVIKNNDISDVSLSDAFQLMYNTNQDQIARIALFSSQGELLEVAPAGRMKEGVRIMAQDWYWDTLKSEENISFGDLMVEQNFETNQSEYTRVIPMTRVVQMNVGNRVEKGILLIELKYSGFQDVFDNLLFDDGSYLYLTDGQGNILYHPQLQLVDSGYLSEGDLADEETTDGASALVKTIGYTGWKIIGVTQRDTIVLSYVKSGLFIVFLLLLSLNILGLINLYLSKKLSEPMTELEEAVNRIEEGDLDVDIQPSGFYEIWHLGTAVAQMQERLKKLMTDIVAEHEAKRKSEIMVLQNQINPHFLYNTLDIIVWMIENEKKNDAVDVVTALARFFRISLSKGKTIIPVADELEHVHNYLRIQEMRYKNRFSYRFDIETSIAGLGTIKLILQPIVENAVYHAMEFMDGDGEIVIRVYRRGEDLCFSIQDNGCGMEPQMMERLMAEEVITSAKGAGVGFRNVRERIRLVFGREYGLEIFSEPDVGTQIIICIPAIAYETLQQRGLDV